MKKFFTVALLSFVMLSFNAFATCSNPSGDEGTLIYNSTVKMLQFCDNTKWVNAAGTDYTPSGYTGGRPTYMGLTPGTYDGENDANGVGNGLRVKGGDDRCNAAFAGSRMMRGVDAKYVATSITSNTYGWVHCEEIAEGSGSGYTSCPGIASSANSNGTLRLYPNCQGWDQDSSGYYGLRYNGSTGVADWVTCNNTYAIHCVKD